MPNFELHKPLPWHVRLAKLAAHRGNSLLVESIGYERRIRRLQRLIGEKATMTNRLDLSDYASEMEDISGRMQHTLSNPDIVDDMNFTDYYRLKSHHAFLAQRIFAPTAFSNHQYHSERAELLDGSYGINASILESAISSFNTPGIPDIERKRLVGVINEQTPLALINRAEVPSAFAMTSSVYEDLFMKQDLTFLYLPKRTPYVRGVQVKTKFETHDQTIIKRGAADLIHIESRDFDNDISFPKPFPTSLRIINEAQGTIANDEQSRLTLTHKKLMSTIINAIQMQQSLA